MQLYQTLQSEKITMYKNISMWNYRLYMQNIQE